MGRILGFWQPGLPCLKDWGEGKGHCEDLEKRLKEHNAGRTKSTRPYLPYELAYFESFETEMESIKREKYFKTSAGRRYLKGKLKP